MVIFEDDIVLATTAQEVVSDIQRCDARKACLLAFLGTAGRKCLFEDSAPPAHLGRPYVPQSVGSGAQRLARWGGLTSSFPHFNQQLRATTTIGQPQPFT